MKKMLFLFCFIVAHEQLFSQMRGRYECKAQLLTEMPEFITGCGDIIYSSRLKFKLIKRSEKKYTDIFSLIVECPDFFMYDSTGKEIPSFWKKGRIYIIVYDTVLAWTPQPEVYDDAKKYRLLGEIYSMRIQK